MISASILYMPSVTEREENAKRISDTLTDRGIDVSMIEGETGGDIWTGHKRGLERGGGEYHITLEDDIELCDGFVDNLYSVYQLTNEERSVVSLLNPRVNPLTRKSFEAEQSGCSLVKTRNAALGPAVLWNDDIVEPFLSFNDDRNERFPYWDVRLWWFFFLSEFGVLVPTYSMVDTKRFQSLIQDAEYTYSPQGYKYERDMNDIGQSIYYTDVNVPSRLLRMYYDPDEIRRLEVMN